MSFVAGLAGAAQASVSGTLGKRVGSVQAAAFGAIVAAVLLVGLAVVTGRGAGIADVVRQPAWLLLSGVFGAGIVLTLAYAPSRIGTFAAVALMIAGQLLAGASDRWVRMARHRAHPADGLEGDRPDPVDRGSGAHPEALTGASAARSCRARAARSRGRPSPATASPAALGRAAARAAGRPAAPAPDCPRRCAPASAHDATTHAAAHPAPPAGRTAPHLRAPRGRSAGRRGARGHGYAGPGTARGRTPATRRPSRAAGRGTVATRRSRASCSGSDPVQDAVRQRLASRMSTVTSGSSRSSGPDEAHDAREMAAQTPEGGAQVRQGMRVLHLGPQDARGVRSFDPATHATTAP